ncbi:MAG: acetyl-CoA acetyltransferase, partial [Pseudomonadota bacterium]
IWSTTRPDPFTPVETMAKPSEKVALVAEPVSGTVETYTVTYGRDGPMSGIVFGRTESGARFIAAAAPEAMPRLLEEVSPVGLVVAVTSEDERNTFTFA